MGAPDRSIAPIPNADGNMTMPYQTQLSAPAPLTTGLQSGSPGDKPLAIGCAVLSPHRQKCSAPVQRPSRSLAYIQRCLKRGFPVVLATFVGRHINETWI